MQIHSKKVVGATWCPMQTGPAARWMGGERQGGGSGGNTWTSPYPCQTTAHQEDLEGAAGGWGEGPPYVVGSRSKQKI